MAEVQPDVAQRIMLLLSDFGPEWCVGIHPTDGYALFCVVEQTNDEWVAEAVVRHQEWETFESLARQYIGPAEGTPIQ